MLRTKQRTSNSITYRVEGLDSLNTKISEDIGEFNEPMLLVPGRYRIVTGHNADVVEIVDVHPRMRTVLNRSWSELKVRIMDTSQNRVRQLYRLWMQSDNDSDYGYKDVGLDVSIGDDEYGIDHKTWILPAGKIHDNPWGQWLERLKGFCHHNAQ
ncbi:MAG: hypothetical protein LRZ88_04200 [Candidatus Cloacimonetes bacterium]|nr:hypothetical protein [Candidatus Cloacimonadota bacterium]